MGYDRRILWVDLTHSKQRVEDVGEEVLRRHIGGSGLAAYLLSRLSAWSIPPLDPATPLVFSAGPLTGTKVPMSGRYAVAARSPLTGKWGEADSGSPFGGELKGAGFDAMVIIGRAAPPVYLFVREGGVEIRPAGHLWGRDTYFTHDAVREETDSRAAVVCIGTAGEHLVPIASIMSEGASARAAGRTGMGAVMGSKNLKAIAAYGQIPAPIADPASLQASLKACLPNIVKKMARSKEYGTAGGVVGNATIGDLTARNWTINDWIQPAERISGEAMNRTILKKRYYCPTCVVGCGREVELRAGPHRGQIVGGPEYETLAGFGAEMLVDDLDTIAEVNDLCNRHGLDTISASGAIAFAMEARERGYLAGIPDVELIEWGNGEAVIALVEKIARQDGIGEFLGRGVQAMAEALGEGTRSFAMHVRGLEFPYHDPRALGSLALAYATHPRGACHRSNTQYTERHAFPELGLDKSLDRFCETGKPLAVARMQDYAEIYNCLKLCQFLMQAVRVSEVVDWLNAVTGWDMDVAEFLRVGERNNNLKRLYNLRLGSGANDDTLPARTLQERFQTGGSAGYVPDLKSMLAEYYAIRGWDEQGVPTRKKLAELGLLEYARTVGT